MADSEKLCELMSEFGRVCERRKLKVNVGKSKVIRFSRYSNGGRKQFTHEYKPVRPHTRNLLDRQT